MRYIWTSILVQFILPCMVVAGSYTCIVWVSSTSAQRIMNSCSSQTLIRKMRRMRRTNYLLIISSIIFFVSWAPINILTIIINVNNLFQVINQWVFTEEALSRIKFNHNLLFYGKKLRYLLITFESINWIIWKSLKSINIHWTPLACLKAILKPNWDCQITIQRQISYTQSYSELPFCLAWT